VYRVRVADFEIWLQGQGKSPTEEALKTELQMESCCACARYRLDDNPDGGNHMAESSPSSSSPLERIRAVVPKLADLTEKVLFGDVWERPGLSKRDRSLITVATLIALYRPEQLHGHIGRALANGVTKDEISEIITHLAFYSGWPTAISAAGIAKAIFEEQK
jgi:4-carboxymuconolactone decarboxylase